MRDKELLGLDIIRFFSACLVMWYHLAFYSWVGWGGAAGILSFPSLIRFSWFGWVGVSIFFVLSGFVIVMTADGKTPGQFLRSRFLRLYPAIWICAPISAFCLYLIGAHPHDIASRLLRSLMLFPANYYVDGSYWSLSIEISFYLLIFGLLLIHRFNRLSWLLYALSIIGFVFWICVFVERFYGTGHFLHGIAAARITALLLVHGGCFFATGGLLWMLIRRGFSPLTASLLGVAILTGCLEIAWVNPVEGSEDPFWRQFNASHWVPVLVWLAAVGCIALSAIVTDLINKGLERFAPTIRRLGLVTYPLYLIHQVVGVTVMVTGTRHGLPQETALIFALILMIVLSFLLLRAEKSVRAITASGLDRVGPFYLSATGIFGRLIRDRVDDLLARPAQLKD
jgi:peptidoglycan/LPS O-acetylase OafA/YrhL